MAVGYNTPFLNCFYELCFQYKTSCTLAKGSNNEMKQKARYREKEGGGGRLEDTQRWPRPLSRCYNVVKLTVAQRVLERTDEKG